VAVGVFGAAPAARAAAAKAGGKVFASAEDAVTALVEALDKDDLKALMTILGPEARSLIFSGDDIADDQERNRFVKSYREAHSLLKGGDGTEVLQVGSDSWPFPIPIVKDAAGWRFDTRAGRDELLARRIGANELSAMQVCLAVVDAQREYWERNPERSAIPHYARRVSSTKGKRDGLYWESPAGSPPSPLGPAFAEAQRQGYDVKGGKPIPYHGYFYRILTRQGPAAPGGAYDYLVRGQMMGGFALVAYPAQWGASGVMTFMVNHDGQLYEKNLGPQTTSIAEAMKEFNPDSTWQKVTPPAQ